MTTSRKQYSRGILAVLWVLTIIPQASSLKQNPGEVLVFFGGIFSNLETFEDGLGGELAKEGYDVWTIELNGGPQIECSTCPDYTYQDQVDYFWPALVTGATNGP